MHPLLEELQRRFADMFTALAAGDDLPPAARLRVEGMMESAVIAGIADEAEVSELMQPRILAGTGLNISAFPRSRRWPGGRRFTPAPGNDSHYCGSRHINQAVGPFFEMRSLAMTSKPCRSYRGTLILLELSRYAGMPCSSHT